MRVSTVINVLLLIVSCFFGREEENMHCSIRMYDEFSHVTVKRRCSTTRLVCQGVENSLTPTKSHNNTILKAVVLVMIYFSRTVERIVNVFTAIRPLHMAFKIQVEKTVYFWSLCVVSCPGTELGGFWLLGMPCCSCGDNFPVASIFLFGQICICPQDQLFRRRLVKRTKIPFTGLTRLRQKWAVSGENATSTKKKVRPLEKCQGLNEESKAFQSIRIRRALYQSVKCRRSSGKVVFPYSSFCSP